MEQSTSWKADGSSATQQIPHTLLNPKVHYHDLPLVPILSRINPVHVLHLIF
jgi:hypothetical protein